MTDTVRTGEPPRGRRGVTLMETYAFITGMLLGLSLVMGLAGAGVLNL